MMLFFLKFIVFVDFPYLQ